MTTYDESLRSPKMKDWEQVMNKFATDQALSTWRAVWQGEVKYGLHRRGTASAAARVESAGLTSDGREVVSVRACMNFSTVDLVDLTNHQVPLAPGLPTKNFAWLLTIEKSGDQMRVAKMVTQTPSGKSISC